MNSTNVLETIITIIILQEVSKNDKFKGYFNSSERNIRRKRRRRKRGLGKGRRRSNRNKSDSSQDEHHSDRRRRRQKKSDPNNEKRDSEQGDDSELDEELSPHIIVCDGQLDKEELKEIVKRRGGRIEKRLPLINGFACQLGKEEHKIEVESMKGVEKVEKDLTLEIKSEEEELSSSNYSYEDEIPWGIEAIKTLDAWDDLNEVKIGIIDTGIDLNHYDLIPVQNGMNIISPRQLPADDNGHGTHVSGTIAARKNNEGILGVAPEIKIYPIKAFNKDGKGKISSLVEALQWSIRNDIKILNMSFGVSEDTTALEKAITAAHKEGIIMIAAAGNDGSASLNFPARYPEVIAVGAVNERGNLANFSNYGEGLDVLAPGVNVKSTWLDDEFKELNGTSMATPHVTGIAALTFSLSNKLSPNQFKEFLKQGATPINFLSSKKQGAGLANAAQTIKLVKEEINAQD